MAGIGLGYERANENFDGPAPNRKSDGFTLTGTVARIINENNSAMLVPQIGITYLDKRIEGGRSERAWRTMGSLALVGTRALNDVELTGIGQLVYTHEDTAGSNGGSSYIAQSVLRGEVAFTKTRKFILSSASPAVTTCRAVHPLATASATRLPWVACRARRENADTGNHRIWRAGRSEEHKRYAEHRIHLVAGPRAFSRMIFNS